MVEYFWRELDASAPAWWLAHPQRAQVRADPRHAIPFCVFGDDGAVGRTRGIRAMHWFAPTSVAPSDESRVPLYAVLQDHRFLKRITEASLQRLAVTSLNLATTGIMPDVSSLPPQCRTAERAAASGRAQAGGHFLVCLGSCADWKWRSEPFAVLDASSAHVHGRLWCAVCTIPSRLLSHGDLWPPLGTGKCSS